MTRSGPLQMRRIERQRQQVAVEVRIDDQHVGISRAARA